MTRRKIAVASALFTALVLVATEAHAQTFSVEDSYTDGVVFSDRVLEREYESPMPLLDYDGRYIVVHLQENRVFVFDRGRAIWSSPAATGKDFVLSTEQHAWDFNTPVGLMQVRRVEKDPMWEAPDWHFIEKGLPVPPQDSPRRFIPGGMGTSAIYLGDGIAIHGTDKPHLVLNPDPEARRVSHGCIRLTDEAARELMHMVDIGTPVLIF